MFIAYRSDVGVDNLPVSNFIVIGLTSLLFCFVSVSLVEFDSFLLDGFNTSLINHALMHKGIFHLLGNMFFLWVFGNIICSRVGSPTYPILYIGLIAISGTCHLVFDGDPAVGASGAVNGMIGMYLYFYPNSNIKCMWTLPFWWGDTFHIKAYVLLIFWFLKDVYGATYGHGNIAYIAHIAGFIGGIGIAWLITQLGWVEHKV